jgi:pyruvate/2-oxoglutarate dehydrogenase complex dihydrolipoamide acyltransferase (E2) component
MTARIRLRAAASCPAYSMAFEVPASRPIRSATSRSWRTAPDSWALRSSVPSARRLVRIHAGRGEHGGERVLDLALRDRLAQEAGEGLARIGAGGETGRVCGEAVQALDEDAPDELLLGGEVAEQRADADARGARDLLGGRGDPARVEHRLGRVEDLPAVAQGVGAQRTLGARLSR